MLDASLAGEGRVGGADTDRQVAGNRQAVPAGLVDHGPVRIRRHRIADLDEVDAGSIQIVDGSPSRLRRVDAPDERQLER